MRLAINTEKGTLENIKINGYEGVYIINNSANVMLWYDGVYTYRIFANLDKEEILKIAESTSSK